MKKWLGVAVTAIIAAAISTSGHAADKKGVKSKVMKDKGLYATFDTSMGAVICKLFEDKTPVTVKNFMGLADGSKEWTDPKTGQKVKKRFYDGLIFHRVIPNFMIQGGCPLGQGTSGPGYQFQDEIVKDLSFNKPGLLAMANSGPGTNGSQFFITHIATDWLTGKHTIFGEVLEGMDVVTAIGNAPKGVNDRPNTPIVIKKVTITRVK